MVETAGCQAWYYGQGEDSSHGDPLWGSNDQGAQNALPRHQHLDNSAGSEYNHMVIVCICIYAPR